MTRITDTALGCSVMIAAAAMVIFLGGLLTGGHTGPAMPASPSATPVAWKQMTDQCADGWPPYKREGPLDCSHHGGMLPRWENALGQILICDTRPRFDTMC